MRTQDRQPITVNDAIELLIEKLSKDQKSKINKMSESDLAGLHFGLGMWVRNSFGLLYRRSSLLKGAGVRTGDDASALILKLLWYRLRGESAKAASFLEESRNRALEATPRVAISEIPEYLRRNAD